VSGGVVPSPLRSLAGWLALLVLVGIFTAFVGFPLIFWMAALGFGLAIAGLAPAGPGDPLGRRAARALAGLLLGPLFVAGICAPLRLAALGGVHLLERLGKREPTVEILYFPLSPVPWIDPAAGLMATAITLYWGIRNRGRILRVRAQIRNLPTSEAASAAHGLAEFKGVVRRIEEPGRDGVQLKFGDPANPCPEPEEARDCVLYDRQAAPDNRSFTKWSRFWLEDRSGRILVDPRGVSFWSGGFFLTIEAQSLLLSRRRRRAPAAGAGVLSQVCLREGDRVFVIGSAEVDPQAPSEAVGSEHLVVRPTKLYPAQGLLSRLFHPRAQAPAEDYKNTFFVYDRDEGSASRMLKKEEGVLVATAILWLGFSLGLFWVGHYHPFAFAEPARQVALQEPQGYAHISVRDGWIMGSWPFSRTIGGRSTEFGQGLPESPENLRAMAALVHLMYPRLVMIESAQGQEQPLMAELEKLGLRCAVVPREEILAYSNREPTWGTTLWTFAVELDARLGEEGLPPPRPYPAEYLTP
jgi:hypothetical protein